LSSQFAPGKPLQILVTSADSRIRILDGSEVVQKYRGAAKHYLKLPFQVLKYDQFLHENYFLPQP